MASQFSEATFDLMSYCRRGPGRRDSVSRADIQQITRTVGRTPEAMVKVLSRGANDLTAVRKHLDYIGRKGKVDLEIDDGEKRPIDELLYDWDLDLDESRPQSQLSATDGRQPPRLVHKVLFLEEAIDGKVGGRSGLNQRAGESSHAVSAPRNDCLI